MELLSRSEKLKASVSLLQALERFTQRPLGLVMHLPKAKELYVREWERNLQKRTCSVSFPPFVHASTSQASVREVSEREREKKERWSPPPTVSCTGQGCQTKSWDVENIDV